MYHIYYLLVLSNINAFYQIRYSSMSKSYASFHTKEYLPMFVFFPKKLVFAWFSLLTSYIKYLLYTVIVQVRGQVWQYLLATKHATDRKNCILFSFVLHIYLPILPLLSLFLSLSLTLLHFISNHLLPH